ncbi:hypothetical protein INS49_004484 [Diaporthe citri]|uniref:uncharacterized protein n=1 Tax=Diaporthe citri TaxID=83186 RepID=UPI001C7FFE8E|nr:uncharacterized protein INS49_004484 [Diaporthe citri]KAG6354467.1 hypothetical protein INS49_004484 [Diaporthe citri]
MQVRKYQNWKWKTTKLVLGLLEAGTVAHAEQHRTQLERHFAQQMSEVITPFMRSSPDGHEDALVEIIHEAVEFDKVLSQIVPRFTWVFSPGPIESPFDFSLEQEGIMKLHAGEEASKKLARGTRTRVYLVVAPGLTSRGADDGSPRTLEAENWLSPMEVTCVKPKRQRFSAAEDSSDTMNTNSPLPP